MNIKLSKAEHAELSKLLNSEYLTNIENIDIEILRNLSKKLIQDNSIKMFVDGAADLHSKTAGIGGVIFRNNEEMYSFSEFIGSATNNEAEYSALIKGIDCLVGLNIANAEIYADSELIVKQVNGEYKVKNERMQRLHSKAMLLLKKIDSWTVNHVPREKNTVADKLSKEGMRSKK